jgi:hypothetical protein
LRAQALIALKSRLLFRAKTIPDEGSEDRGWAWMALIQVEDCAIPVKKILDGSGHSRLSSHSP